MARTAVVYAMLEPVVTLFDIAIVITRLMPWHTLESIIICRYHIFARYAHAIFAHQRYEMLLHTVLFSPR